MSLRSNARRTTPLVAAAVLAVATLPVFASTAAQAATTPAQVGLYGSQDPSFDGVYRQSLSLLALTASGQTPAAAAVSWLLGQQCADGGFEAYRADVHVACTAPDSAGFSGEDTDSTGMAVQALEALGKHAEAAHAVGWLGAHQNTDGGWAYYPDGLAGNASDANSTALGLSGYLATSTALPTQGGLSPVDLLASLQVGCSGAVDEQGAFTFFGTANDYATVQATLAMGQGFLPVPAATGADDAPSMTCPGKQGAKPAAVPVDPAASSGYAAGYLVRRLAANANLIPDPFNPGSADVGSTANAVLALVATKHGSSQVAATLTALGAQAGSFTRVSGADVPGALAVLALADVAGGGDPSSFGGSNLVARLAATIRVAPTTSPSPSASPPRSAQAGDPTPSVSPSRLAATGASGGAGASGLLAGVLLVGGSALVLAVRRGSRRPRHGHGS